MKAPAIRRALLEAAFVIVGILVAFSIDAWWDDRQEMEVHDAVLASLANEIARNQELVASDTEIAGRHLELIDRFLRATPEELATLPNDTLMRSFMNAFGNPVTHDPETAVARMLMQRPARDADGLRVQEETGRWLRIISDSEEQAEALWTLAVEAWPAFARNSLPYASDGLASMTWMNARVSPQGLGQIRANPELTARIIAKGQMQGNYRRQLRFSAALLDSLAVIVADAR